VLVVFCRSQFSCCPESLVERMGLLFCFYSSFSRSFSFSCVLLVFCACVLCFFSSRVLCRVLFFVLLFGFFCVVVCLVCFFFFGACDCRVLLFFLVFGCFAPIADSLRIIDRHSCFCCSSLSGALFLGLCFRT